MSQNVSIVLEKDDDGCQTQGDTVEDVLATIHEAIELYLETLTEEELRALLSTNAIRAHDLRLVKNCRRD